MAEVPGSTGTPNPVTDQSTAGRGVFDLDALERDAMLAWVGEHLTLVRRSASGQRVSYWILGIGFVLGLAAHVGGFMLKFSSTSEPVLLVGDLIYALGWALWTSIIVVMFVEIWPEAKKRQYKRALDEYEAALGHQAGVGNGQTSVQADADDT